MKLDSGKQFSFGYDYKLSSKAKVFYFFTDLNGNQDSKEKEIHGAGLLNISFKSSQPFYKPFLYL